MTTASLLDDLNPAQREAVTTDAAPLCILAGAGSGKTRVITRRIAYRVATGAADPSHVLAITFTRKAAAELRRRLAELGVRERILTGTFHAIAYAQLRQWWADTGQTPPELTQSKMRLLAPLVSRARGNVELIDLVSEIEWAKARLLDPEAYEAEAARLERKPPLGVAGMAAVYARYEAEKRRRGVVDFDDLLAGCVRALERDREFAARQRWRFRHLYVDEYQDVNPAQQRLLDAWRGNARDLCVVGDPNQAIYAWNGADPSYLLDFAHRNPGSTVVRLEDNYRSSPQILTVADSVLGTGMRESRAMRPNRAEGPVPVVSSYVSERDEAKHIARLLRDRHGGRVAWSDMAVLARTNAQLLVFEEAFRAAGIPHRVRGEGPLLGHVEIRKALGDLRQGAAASSFVAAVADLEEAAANARTTGTTSAEGTNDRADRLDALVRLAHEYSAIDTEASSSGFTAWLSATITGRADEPDRGGDVVELTTFHRSKGLEWPIVCVAGLERGFVPIGQANDPEAFDEERRLLYVAVTRAERELHLSWAQQRTFGSRTTGRSPSPWLDNIDAAIESLAHPEKGDWRTLLRAQRERLAAAKQAGVPGIRGTKRAKVQVGAGADPKVLEALKTWRLASARANGVPAFVILHDTTLAAIAEALPATPAALAELPGVGAVKLSRYGDEVLAVVRQAIEKVS